MSGPKSLKETRVNLGMLMLSILMLLTTFWVRLKMESLSGLTDLVVSMTNMRGGLRGLLDLGPEPEAGPGDSGQRAHWQLPRHLSSRAQKSSALSARGSH